MNDLGYIYVPHNIIMNIPQAFQHLRWMTQNMGPPNREYPDIVPGKTSQKFKRNFCEFVRTLVRMCHNAIFYDDEDINDVFIPQQEHPMTLDAICRHNTTVTVMKLITTLLDGAVTTSMNYDACLREYEDHKRSNHHGQARASMQQLTAQQQELDNQMEEINNMLSHMFNAVFVHGEWHTVTDLRPFTLAEINVWMDMFRTQFLDHLYLKFIGWTLYDQDGEIRTRCLEALQGLYYCDNLRNRLLGFTLKYKDHLVYMTRDRHMMAAVEAVTLISGINKMYPDILTDFDCEVVYSLVYTPRRLVAVAAGEFLNERLFRCDSPPVPAARTLRGKKRLPNTPLLRGLLHFYKQSEEHQPGSFLVDAMINCSSMITDWECMTDLLLEEPGPEEEILDRQTATCLIELMACSVRQASTGSPPEGRLRPGEQVHVLFKVQSQEVTAERTRMTSHFLTTLPLLLDKYFAETDKMLHLLIIPQYYDLVPFSNADQKPNLVRLLDKLLDILRGTFEVKVVQACVRTLEVLYTHCDNAYANSNNHNNRFSEAEIKHYQEAINAYRIQRQMVNIPDAGEQINVMAPFRSLRCLAVMCIHETLKSTEIWESLIDDLPKCLRSAESPMPIEAMQYIVRVCLYSLFASLRDLKIGRVTTANAEELRERVEVYSNHCCDIMMDGASAILREMAYRNICNLFILFSDQTITRHLENTPAARLLIFSPDADVCDLLKDFVEEFVFTDCNYDLRYERYIRKYEKRRGILSSYFKLVTANVVPIRRSVHIFKYYAKFYRHYGDIMADALLKIRDVDVVECAVIMELSMQALFLDLTVQLPMLDSNSPDFKLLQTMGTHFSRLFGPNEFENSEALITMQKEGITFAALNVEETIPRAPPNLLFLKPLAEFCHRMMPMDKDNIAQFLECKFGPSARFLNGDDWAPLSEYYTTLYSPLNYNNPFGCEGANCALNNTPKLNNSPRELNKPTVTSDTTKNSTSVTPSPRTPNSHDTINSQSLRNDARTTYTPQTTYAPDSALIQQTTSAPASADTLQTTTEPRSAHKPQTSSAPSAPHTPQTTSAPKVSYIPQTTSALSPPHTPQTTSAPRASNTAQTTSAPSAPHTPQTTSAPSPPHTPQTTSAPSPPHTPQTTSAPRSSYTAQATSALRASYTAQSTNAPRASYTAHTTSAPRASYAAQSTSAPRASYTTQSTSGPRASYTTQTTSAPRASYTAQSTSTPRASYTAQSTSAPRASYTAHTSSAPRASYNAQTTSAPRASYTAQSTSAPRASYTAKSTSAPRASYSAQITSAPRASYTAQSTSAPRASYTAQSTSAPRASYSAQITSAPRASFTAQSTSAPRASYTAQTNSAPRASYTAQSTSAPRASYTAHTCNAPRASYTTQTTSAPRALYTAQTMSAPRAANNPWAASMPTATTAAWATNGPWVVHGLWPINGPWTSINGPWVSNAPMAVDSPWVARVPWTTNTVWTANSPWSIYSPRTEWAIDPCGPPTYCR